ncbi:hypothetical protein XAP412_200091 [Xanthomonas phaseoli pv. phaseoli]|uniref:Uncharacterized protein n=1 Tax=Xanthomonas campestris pv. phaseoli TaxID=317013 RepID=A0AB38DYD6_XANCH|nr:hypothetical protein XAP6984_270091 [Xanthomonas phaseoli pv. phaseoli]SON81155.1 hypothetical protein XAP412_200091 [Xanthomonas phaseoli pv. phaseoli]SON85720.1 hypothetical protein XAP7430_220089 [Xanthomonas phaseoli pv. phaseoli]SOO29589.1 hypothetical protein XAP6164_3440003 [Xanthomonas phaseoli pv. phaseoli]
MANRGIAERRHSGQPQSAGLAPAVEEATKNLESRCRLSVGVDGIRQPRCTSGTCGTDLRPLSAWR